MEWLFEWGILGCGRMSRHHARRILEHPDAELAALWRCRHRPHRALGRGEPCRSRWRVRLRRPAYGRLRRAMYREAALDAVSDLHSPHRSLRARQAGDRGPGAHVFHGEADGGPNTGQARELERAGGRLPGASWWSAITRRARRRFRYLRELVRAGTLGKTGAGGMAFCPRNWRIKHHRYLGARIRRCPAAGPGLRQRLSPAQQRGVGPWSPSPERVFRVSWTNQGTPVDINSVFVVALSPTA